MNAYEGLLKEAMHPGYFLYLDVPPHTIDINIHPTKTEIKFEEEQAIYAILRSAVKHSLGQFQIAPVLDFERDPNLDTPYEYNRLDASIPLVDFNPQFNPFNNSENNKSNSGSSSYTAKRVPQESWESLYTGIPEISQELVTSMEEEPVVSSLFGEEEPEETKQASYFQIHRKYVVSPIKSGLLVIHQNRAHQRILYEQLLEQMMQFNAVSQPLLFPVSVKLSVIETQMLQELQPVLHALGFQLEFASTQEVLFHALPNHAEANQIEQIIQEVLHELEFEQQKTGKQSEMIAKTIAKANSQSSIYSIGFRRLTVLPKRVRQNINLACVLKGELNDNSMKDFFNNMTEQEFVNWLKLA
jgi:DNA mismatch repair protein MutL